MRPLRTENRKSAIGAWLACALGVLACGLPGVCFAQAALVSTRPLLPTIYPEARSVEVREPHELPQYPLPATPPATVTQKYADRPTKNLSLDEAIRLSLLNARVVRVLAGVTAVASGRTIYDPAIALTQVDQQQATFDPNVVVNQSWNKFERPGAALDPMVPGTSVLTGATNGNYSLNAGVAQQNPLGGTWRVEANAARDNFRPGTFPLNPQTTSDAAISYTQPLLFGAGPAANLAPIVITRIQTERSYFQFKESMQELVRGTIEAYWNLVAARVDHWARQRQVDQAEYSFQLAQARAVAQIQSAAESAQARVQLLNFRAALVTAEANVLQREAALRNLIGLPPADGVTLVPTTPLLTDRYLPKWDALVALAAERRPDLIELKLILEADQQQLIVARNAALPQLDAVALYRWNGLEGEMPNSTDLSTRPGQFTDWTFGVNFSVPVGLRHSRAALRQQELILTRDRANLDQGLHAAVHSVATSVRTLDQTYEQYRAFKQARQASLTSLELQFGRYRANLDIYLNVLTAINDWGNAVSNEAASLTQYNTELANLERETGTILESHGIRFYEERFGSLGPLGRLFPDACYAESLPATPNTDRYRAGDAPSERGFELEYPDNWRRRRIELPREPGEEDRQLPPELLPPREPEPIPAPQPRP